MLNAVEWARENGRKFEFRTHTDNYEPPRGTFHGVGSFYDHENGERAILDGVSGLRGFKDAVYLLDDGRTVRPFYVASWHPDGSHVILCPFPTNFDGEGNPRMRADNSAPVDFSSWMLGPRRFYHLKVKGESS